MFEVVFFRSLMPAATECRPQPYTSTLAAQQSDDSKVAVDTSLTVVLNVYRRVENMLKQLDSLAASTHTPTEIWVCLFATKRTDDFMRSITTFKNKHRAIRVHTIESGYNFKYFGRFQLAMQASTKYVAFFDDDQIPGRTTLELLVNTAEKLEHPAILGLTGRTFKKSSATHGMEWYHMSNFWDGQDWFENGCKRTTGTRAPCRGGSFGSMCLVR